MSQTNNNYCDCSDALLIPEDVRIIGATKYRYSEEMQTFSSLLEEIIIHENFSRTLLENNIAIGIVGDSLIFLSATSEVIILS
jgi:hypothetical protein